MHPKVHEFLTKMVQHEASDLYLTVGRPPTMRVNDHLQAIGADSLNLDGMNEILTSILDDKQMEQFKLRHEMNMSFGVSGMGRFRVNVMHQRQAPAVVIRAIKNKVPSFEELGLPEILKKLVMSRRGIILLCGMTGAGKSTTLAAMVDHRNRSESGHIITIEDPVEYLHDHQKSIITQREVGVDTENYHVALKNAFRQKPDVILIGEIRDRYVMEQGLVAAETGHLCLSTIHANNAYQAIERILNFFDDDQLHQARINLAMNLRAIVSQRLVRTKDGGRALAYEIMLNEGYVRELIIKGETGKIRDVMAQNQSNGMMTFDTILLKLYNEGQIEAEVAIKESDFPVDMELQIKKANATRTNVNLGDVDTSGFRL